MILSVNYKYLTLCLIALGIYILWMDVGMYLELQKFKGRTPGNLLNISGNKTTPTPYTFSPFCPIRVKLLLLPPTVQYVDEPLAYFTVYHSRISDFVSPNAVSFLGVAIAAVSARFLAHSDIKYRHLGVLLFKVRDYMDGLDGDVARERSQTHYVGQVANPDSFGWMVDGVCDGLGDIFRFLAFIAVMKRALSNGKTGAGAGSGYALLDVEKKAGGLCPIVLGEQGGRLSLWMARAKMFLLTHSRALVIVACVGFQSLFSSFMWNYFMINYHRVLETDQYWGDVNYQAVVDTQAGILRSSSMWMVFYFWRLVNPQMITQIQLLAVLYDREVDLLLAVQLIGYLPPALVGLGSYLHLQLAEEAVRAAAFAVYRVSVKVA